MNNSKNHYITVDYKSDALIIMFDLSSPFQETILFITILLEVEYHNIKLHEQSHHVRESPNMPVGSVVSRHEQL